MNDNEKRELIRQAFKEYGAKGGRPRTVAHIDGEKEVGGWVRGCRCMECRKLRKWGKAGKNQEPVDFGVHKPESKMRGDLAVDPEFPFE